MCAFQPVQILVIGREGSLRTQRRHGSAYLLSGRVESGRLKYSEYSQGVSSRSGHTATFVGSKLYIIGGRSDNLLEVCIFFPPVFVVVAVCVLFFFLLVKFKGKGLMHHSLPVLFFFNGD